MRLRTATAFILLAAIGASFRAASAVERAIDKEVLVDATVDRVWEAWTSREGITGFFYRDFDKAWNTVLGNLQKRLAPGGKPTDWTEWLEQMKKP